jgi:putative hydrolase of the HAD superfamily
VHNEYVLSGKADIAKARYIRFRKLYERIGIIDEHSDHDLAADMYREIYLQNRILVEGAAELLEDLSKNYKLGIISNNQHQEQLGKLEHLQILKYFDKVITSELAGFKKPEKEIFIYAFNEFNIKKEEAILIGDSWESDIIGALNSGIRAIWLNRTGTNMQVHNDVSEIRSFIPKENILKLLV